MKRSFRINKIFILLCTFIVISVCGSGLFGQNSDEPDETKTNDNSYLIHEPVFNSNIYFRETGKEFKQSILLVHGIGEDASDIWKNLIPVLENKYHVINFDLPGFGRSDKEDALYSPANYAVLLKWIYYKYINRPMVLVGHSMGAAISLYYAGTYPETVERLILADAAGILHGAALSRILTRYGRKESDSTGILQEQIELFRYNIESIIEGTSRMLPKDISIILETPFLRRLAFNSPKKIASAALINTDFGLQIENINAPLCLIWGDKDMIAPLRTGRMLSYSKPGALLKIMPGLGHNPMLEKPSEFNKLIEECIVSDASGIIKNKISYINKKNIIINGKENAVFEGMFETIEIKNCRNIQIKNAKSGSIKINNSTVEIENTVITSDKTGIFATGSEISITGGSIVSSVGLLLVKSKIDLAGVKITAIKAALSSTGEDSSIAIFSVCKIKSSYNSRYFHEVIEIKEEKPL
jgi:pimeloyl-ACP methyl ester carboxylesterase